MHRQAAAAIERLRPQDLESLAFHALEGGNLAKGLDFSMQAAEKAQRMFAAEEALLHYGRAREIAESLDLPAQLSTIHEAIGDLELWRDIPKSIDAFERALNLATVSEKRATIKSKIGSAYVLVGDERGLGFLEAAEKELNPDTQGNELARTIGAVGRLYHHHGQHQRALTYLERARQIAEPLDEPLTLTYIYSFLAGSHQHLANLDESMEWAWQSIALGERKDHPLAVKKALARRIISDFHDADAAAQAQKDFEAKFHSKGVDPNAPVNNIEVVGSVGRIDAWLVEQGMCKSKSEAQRHIKAGAVSLAVENLKNPVWEKVGELTRGRTMMK